jgi:hypothetical protein
VRFAFWTTLLIGAVALASVLYVLLQPTPFHITFLIEFNIPQWELALVIGAVYVIGLGALWICMFAYYKRTILYNIGCFSYWWRYKSHISRFRRKLMHSSNPQSVAEQHLIWATRFGSAANQANIVLMGKKQIMESNDRNNWLSYFVPVLTMTIFGESLISTFILPEFDVLFSPGGKDLYNMWLGLRTVVLAIAIPLNVAVVYPVYRIVSPTMKYNYMDDSIESRTIPLTVD